MKNSMDMSNSRQIEMKKESECEINLKPSRIQLREKDTGYMKENLK